MSTGLLPTPQELLELVNYLINNPYLFISSTTVITSVIVGAAIVLRLILIFARVLGVVIDRTFQVIAPTVALVMMYFGIGAMLLATQILVRFHSVIPRATEEQFRSGVGHLVIAVVGVLALVPWLRRRSARTWLLSNIAALAYWTYQVVVLTPPWFSFQNQRFLVLIAVAALLSASATATILGLVWTSRRAARAIEHESGIDVTSREPFASDPAERDAA